MSALPASSDIEHRHPHQTRQMMADAETKLS
jgi:hypothetical protein